MNRKAFFKVLGASIVALVSHKLPSKIIEQQPAPIEELVIDWRDNTSGFNITQVLEEMVDHVDQRTLLGNFDQFLIIQQLREDIYKQIYTGFRCPITIEFHSLDCCIQTNFEGAGEI